MESLGEREIEYLAALKEKPLDFETYPPVFQTQLFAEYIIQRGANCFTPKDIQTLFHHAELKKALNDRPNRPTPSVVRRYINNAIKDGKLQLEFDEKTDQWLVLHPVFTMELCVEVKATDRLHAKDAVRLSMPNANSIVRESVTEKKPWVVTLQLLPKYTSRPSVVAEMIDLMAMMSRKWMVAIVSGNLEVESVGKPSIGHFQNVSVKLCKTNSA